MELEPTLSVARPARWKTGSARNQRPVVEIKDDARCVVLAFLPRKIVTGSIPGGDGTDAQRTDVVAAGPVPRSTAGQERLRRRAEVDDGTVAITARDITDTLRMSPATLQVLLVIAGLACCIAMSMPQVHIVAYCADLGYGPARGAEMLSLMLGFGVVSRLVSGLIADRKLPILEDVREMPERADVL